MTEDEQLNESLDNSKNLIRDFVDRMPMTNRLAMWTVSVVSEIIIQTSLRVVMCNDEGKDVDEPQLFAEILTFICDTFNQSIASAKQEKDVN